MISKYNEAISEFLELRKDQPFLLVKDFCLQKGLSEKNVYQKAKTLGIRLSANKGSANPFKHLTKFDGNMLGDASLVFKNKQAKRPKYTHTSIHKEYLEWLISELEILNESKIWERNLFDKRNGKTYKTFWTSSRQSEFLLTQRKRWYIESPDGGRARKKLPSELEIDQYLLLHWYLDDGSRASSGGIYYAADDFTLEEVERLAEMIQSFTGFEIGIHRNDQNYRVYLPKRYVRDFLDLIGPCPVKCFDYKWCG